MNTFKTAVVLATLLGVGYGAHVVLNKPISSRNETALAADEWSELPQVDLAEISPHRPALDLPPLRPAATDTAAPLADLAPTSNPPALALTPSFDAQGMSPPLASEPPIANRHAVPDQQQTATFPASTDTMGGRVQPPTPSVEQVSVVEMGTRTDAVTTAELQSAVATNGMFEEIWTSGESKVLAGQFADALFTLSMFYHDLNLSNEQRGRLITRLDQLAGTTIYSTQHTLLPPHTVQPGETLEQIAVTYAVPAEFLARVNGRSTGQALNPGEQLKVVRGPFRGELSLSQREMTVFLGRHYAGRFSVGLGRDFPQQPTTLQIIEKAGARPYTDQRTGQEIPAAAADNPYGSVWLGLAEIGRPADQHLLGIHAAGTGIDASDTRGCISVSEKDARDLRAILSIGSQVAVIE